MLLKTNINIDSFMSPIEDIEHTIIVKEIPALLIKKIVVLEFHKMVINMFFM